jgi:DNA repair protein RadC
MQIKKDTKNIIKLFSGFTGINEKKIENFLKDNSINNLFEYSKILNITENQKEKINDLIKLFNTYTNLKAENKYNIYCTSIAGEYMKNFFKHKNDKEYIVCMFLNNANDIIRTKIISNGTIDECKTYKREMAKNALFYNAKKVILSHNHPGGKLEASNADINLTKNLDNTFFSIDIDLIDHIIIGNDNYFSFAENQTYNFLHNEKNLKAACKKAEYKIF